MTEPIRLNLMCGEDVRDGYVNIDLRDDIPGVVKADIFALPYEDATVAELLALDALEHHWIADVPRLLDEWHRVLVPGGLLTVRVPNLEVLARQIVRGVQLEATIRNIMGGHRFGPGGAWDTHHWNYTPATLAATLSEAGFRVQSNNRAANMTVVARSEYRATT